MTPFASVALYRRNGAVVFRPPRKEQPTSATQARKAAMRYWTNKTGADDTLVKVIVVRGFNGKLEIAERNPAERAWKEFTLDSPALAREPHLVACIAELGIDMKASAPTMPDVITINGVVYRRDI